MQACLRVIEQTKHATTDFLIEEAPQIILTINDFIMVNF